MIRFFLPAIAAVLISTLSLTAADPNPTSATVAPVPHCQVPCGIYGDQLRFEGMLEDTKTIAKAIAQIGELSGKAMDANGMNQAVRWVTNKESHATNIQNVMGAYFFAQRIKSDHKEYAKQLVTAHKVIVAAMKCKQSADPATATALEAAIKDFYTAYEGKAPQEHTHK